MVTPHGALYFRNKAKSYIMFVGDGIGETVVTGNRNFMQGWTTFRTATVGMYLIIILHSLSLFFVLLVLIEIENCRTQV